MAVGELNGDGWPDLAVALRDANAVGVMLGTAGGGFGPAVRYPVGGRPVSVGIADFNTDGQRDLAVANQDPRSVAVLFGTGSGAFGPAALHGPGAINGDLQSLAIGDINGDGKLDTATTAEGISSSSLRTIRSLKLARVKRRR